jgi:hypothetical protein
MIGLLARVARLSRAGRAALLAGLILAIALSVALLMQERRR